MSEPLQFTDEQKVAGDTRWIMRSEWCQSVTARMSGDQSISDSTPTIVAFDAEDHDTNTLHDNVTNNSRLTCLVPGVYHPEAIVSWGSSAVGHRIARIKKNGSSVVGSVIMPVTTGGNTYHPIFIPVRLAYGDYVELEVEQNSGGPLNVVGGGTDTFFSMFRVA